MVNIIVLMADGDIMTAKQVKDLKKKSTDRHVRAKHTDNGECHNHLHQDFNQKAPNLVWASDFTYIRVASKWH